MLDETKSEPVIIRRWVPFLSREDHTILQPRELEQLASYITVFEVAYGRKPTLSELEEYWKAQGGHINAS